MFPWDGQKVHFLPGSYIFLPVRPGSLEVLAYLPPPLLSHLRVVLSGNSGYSLTAVERWDVFADALRQGAADIIVVDPCADGVGRATPLAALLESRLTLPVVVYTPVSPVSFQAIAELARHSAHHAVHHVVLHRYDDEPRRFLELLERQPGTSLTVALLEELAPRLATLPPSLARAVERLVQRPTDFRDVADLARAARATVRTTYRHLERAGLRSPRAVIVVARLLQAYAYARDPRQSLEAIAKKVGYSAPRMLTKHMRGAVGATPRAVRRLMRPSELVYALAQWLAPTVARDPGLALTAPFRAANRGPQPLDREVGLVANSDSRGRPADGPRAAPGSMAVAPGDAAGLGVAGDLAGQANPGAANAPGGSGSGPQWITKTSPPSP